MFDFFKDASLLPHGFCLLWDPWLIGAHLIGDLLIFLAYSAIPVAICIFLRKRPTLAMSNLAWLFALFILFCGLTHLASAVALYQPIYQAQAALKVVTAAVSLATAVVMFPLIPKALAIPSPEELQAVNEQLLVEVDAHRQTADELREARDALQRKVAEQVSALARASAVVAALEESPNVLIYAKTTSGRILMANPACIAAIGRRADEIIGQDERSFLSEPDEIAQIQAVDRAVCAGGETVTAIERVTQPDGRTRSYLSTKVPLRHEDGTVHGIVGVSVDVSEREALIEDLSRSEELLRLGSEAADFGTCVIHIREGQMQVSPSLRHMLALPPDPLSIAALLDRVHSDDRAGVMAVLSASSAAEIEFRSCTDGETMHWYLLRGRRQSDPHERFLGAIADITRRKRAELRTSDLMRELIHRGRNLLTVVQVLARNSLTPPRTLAEARDVLIDRLHAVARGYELFVDGDHCGLTLQQLLNYEANRFPEQFAMTGPEFLLHERAAQTLGLVIHELTTNAAKYGALSQPTGRVSIDWSTKDGVFRFSWREEGGPPVTTPAKEGFGSGLIARVLTSDYQATFSASYPPTGLLFSFSAPFAKLCAPPVGGKARADAPAFAT